MFRAGIKNHSISQKPLFYHKERRNIVPRPRKQSAHPG
jgi:hypothetical protein